MMANRGWRNLSKLRKKLRRLPDEINDEVKEAVVEGGIAIARSIGGKAASHRAADGMR